MNTPRLFVLAIVVFAAVAHVTVAGKPTSAKLRRAKRMLAELKLVDGAGSGLDADTVQGLKPVVVVDSLGNYVGAVLRPDGSPGTHPGVYVVRRVASTPVVFHVTSAGFDNSESATVEPVASYETTDCSGTPLVRPSIDGFYPVQARVAGTTAYYGSAPAINRTVRSVSADCVEGGTPLGDGTCCQAGFPYEDAFQDAVPLDLTTFALTPPFHVDAP